MQPGREGRREERYEAIVQEQRAGQRDAQHEEIEDGMGPPAPAPGVQGQAYVGPDGERWEGEIEEELVHDLAGVYPFRGAVLVHSRMRALTLSIVAPDQYRNQLLDQIATEARAIAARFGPDQRIEARGLDRPVEWRRAGITEVFLYIPHQLTFRPAG